MESMELTACFSRIYAGTRVLVTGHTGFKGSWLCHWLNLLGAEVAGYALPPPTTPSHYALCRPCLAREWLADIREPSAFSTAVRDFRPTIIFHLAAQALVRPSYRTPLETFEVNTMGTAVVLDAIRDCPEVQAAVCITTDKCYRNRDWEWGYRETDELGGHDPYSASKACAELVVDSYRSAFFHTAQSPLIATARAGNVIGGGDWAEDRLIPDLARAVAAQKALIVRNPAATRPWQHVNESLAGYLLLGQRLLEGEKKVATAWNFGPTPRDNLAVADLLATMRRYWPELQSETPPPSGDAPHEARLLMLDCARARQQLGWQPVWELETGIKQTAAWYRAWLQKKKILTHNQIRDYITAAENRGQTWAQV